MVAPAETTSLVHDAESGEVQQSTAATPSTAVRRTAAIVVITLAAVAVFAKGTTKTTETPTLSLSAEEIKAKLGNAWQCNQVCYSDSDCNALTGPCVYCSSGSGSGSGGTCVDSEDDHGVHEDDGDNEPSASPTTSKPTSSTMSSEGDVGCGVNGPCGTGLPTVMPTYVPTHVHDSSTTALIDGEDDEMKQANANGHGAIAATSKMSAEEIKAKLGNAWQCNQVCYSDSDCNALTGPCVYCSSGSGSGSGGTCVDSEDDHGVHEDDGDNEPSASPTTSKPTSSTMSADGDVGCGVNGPCGTGLPTVMPTYVPTHVHDSSTTALIDGEDDEMKQANANGHGSKSA